MADVSPVLSLEQNLSLLLLLGTITIVEHLLSPLCALGKQSSRLQPSSKKKLRLSSLKLLFWHPTEMKAEKCKCHCLAHSGCSYSSVSAPEELRLHLIRPSKSLIWDITKNWYFWQLKPPTGLPVVSGRECWLHWDHGSGIIS